MSAIPIYNGTIHPHLISSGRRLLLSETVCFMENDGLEIKLLASDNKELTFQFCFERDKDKENVQPNIKIDLINNFTIKITLNNFHNPLGTGTTSPITFQIGNKSHFLLIYTTGLENKDNPDQALINMTVSMYQET